MRSCQDVMWILVREGGVKSVLGGAGGGGWEGENGTEKSGFARYELEVNYGVKEASVEF